MSISSQDYRRVVISDIPIGPNNKFLDWLYMYFVRH